MTGRKIVAGPRLFLPLRPVLLGLALPSLQLAKQGLVVIVLDRTSCRRLGLAGIVHRLCHYCPGVAAAPVSGSFKFAAQSSCGVLSSIGGSTYGTPFILSVISCAHSAQRAG